MILRVWALKDVDAMSTKPELPFVTIDNNDDLYLWAILGSDNRRLTTDPDNVVWPGDVISVPSYDMKDYGDPHD